MRLSLAIISNRDHKPWFTKSLCDMLLYSAINAKRIGIKSIQTYFAPNTSILLSGRQKSVWSAREMSATHLLSVDDDMIFPKNAIEILASRNVDIIGVNAVCKDISKLNQTAWDDNGKQIDSSGKSGIQEAHRIGFGMVLIKLASIEGMSDPLFEFKWKGGHPETGEINKSHPYIPEDFYFCEKAKSHGLKIYVDHDLSQNIGHIGDFVYSMHSYDKQ